MHHKHCSKHRFWYIVDTVALGDLSGAEENYSKAIDLCIESQQSGVEQFGVKRCSDLYILLLNRGTVRLNSGMPKEALADLQQASLKRERPDAVILQNLARAKEGPVKAGFNGISVAFY